MVPEPAEIKLNLLIYVGLNYSAENIEEGDIHEAWRDGETPPSNFMLKIWPRVRVPNMTDEEITALLEDEKVYTKEERTFPVILPGATPAMQQIIIDEFLAGDWTGETKKEVRFNSAPLRWKSKKINMLKLDLATIQAIAAEAIKPTDERDFRGISPIELGADAIVSKVSLAPTLSDNQYHIRSQAEIEQLKAQIVDADVIIA